MTEGLARGPDPHLSPWADFYRMRRLLIYPVTLLVFALMIRQQ